MKKFIILFLSLTVVFTNIFATSDYDRGYLDGFAACQKGKENEILIKLDESSKDSANLGVWDLNFFMNEFGEPLEIGFISTPDYIHGTFSNSATTNSELNAYFLIEKENIAIKLLEYSTNVVKGSSSYPEYYIVYVKCDEEVSQYMAENHGDRLSFNNSDSKDFISILRKEKPISISIKKSTSYGFGSFYLLKDIETTGFNEAMKQLNN